jgi:hypothetical protein
MSDKVIRISYVRATFAAGLLAGYRSSLLKITDLLECDRELAHFARRRSGDHSPAPDLGRVVGDIDCLPAGSHGNAPPMAS